LILREHGKKKPTAWWAFDNGGMKLTAMLPTLRTVIHAIVIEVMLPIVFLAIDMPTLHVLGLLQALAFLRCHSAIALGFVFHVLNMLLSLVKAIGFPSSERSGLDSLINALLLILLPLINVGRIGLRECG